MQKKSFFTKEQRQWTKDKLVFRFTGQVLLTIDVSSTNPR